MKYKLIVILFLACGSLMAQRTINGFEATVIPDATTGDTVGVLTNNQMKVTAYKSDGTEVQTCSKAHWITHTADDLFPTRFASISPRKYLIIAPSYRIIGKSFSGKILDHNFWTETTSVSGTVTVAGECELATGATTNGTASVVTTRKARFVAGNPMEWKAVAEFSAGDADNYRRIGAYNDDNGMYFQLDGTTFSVVTRSDHNGGVTNTVVSSGSFNGDASTYVLDTARHSFGIQYMSRKIFFYIDSTVIHTVTLTHDNQPTSFSLPITLENVNDNQNDTNNELHVITTLTSRLGELLTSPTYKYVNGAATTICKYGSGTLHTIVNNNNAGSMVVYDNTAGSGDIIANIDLAKVLGTLTFDVPFNNGLTVVTTGSMFATIVYE